MEYRQVGNSGLTVSALGLGCNNFGMRIDAGRSAEVVGAALEAGITFFDTAPMYGDGASEAYLGSALGGRRADVVLASKFGAPRSAGPAQATGSRRNVIAECEASLRRLGTDYIDIYYQHYPDPHTPIDETLDALDDLVRQGKVRYAASSNVTGWQIVDAHHVGAARGLRNFVATQLEWSLLRRGVEDEIVPAALHAGIGIVAYYPLASGLLTGKYAAGRDFPAGTRLAEIPFLGKQVTPEDFDLVGELGSVAASMDRTLLELALGWVLSRIGLSSVLAGATTPAQVASNAAACQQPLTEDELEAIGAALQATYTADRETTR